MKNYDEKFISYALNLAKRNRGGTAPNPVVACVIVRDGEIISSGVTEKNGRPHAEKIAIEKISDKQILRDAIIYITLEPCSHFGQTPPCVDEIIKCHFQKVVIATIDPDERVNGKGIAKLRHAGIEVVCGILEKEAQEINRGFFKARKTGMPFVTLKLATSLDGKIATKNFGSKWITSKKARRFSHFLRAENDAILVGANTVRKDDPSLDCRLFGLEEFSPKKIILSNRNDFDLQAKIFQNDQPLIIGGKLEEVLKKLCASGINSVLVEGGQKTATEFLQENLVDELVWIRSKKIIGNDGIAAIGEMNFLKISEVLDPFSRQEIRGLEEDVIEVYRKIF
ncbi:MAG: riboflavin biosynthesis protein RibD [Alphaproteobacteria bacterium RIFCSPLOWO2_01_FULL_40_26]|nr:MAG: riboflavin biosynthesis protein RibD [Alphaproteobacteria bacterium RIFCSPHIGHO2_02_FULL_40_34]OFW85412.1 MAG: riboflavin biosynthesis protein RibD [Alphaproteobacteria bacterium RIFCSPHIGHO2_01_FULL_40_8]OFW94120.1 MAG: riboflavin biosynthesis protein RibD [Alphaproteobacteria bacterium RIFCSPLOWO2_01_FULL_40_26]OFX09705.1 MAG: riboflavin biosynthesis protein RibD [Alphaproteobacteria bacterium RIFCSPLOWO2_02_FULL_40_19]OFX11385.1 MAG: riboflavin biosynthesis protein RibD [Alphaproteob